MIDSNATALLGAGIFPTPTNGGTQFHRRQQRPHQCAGGNCPGGPPVQRQILQSSDTGFQSRSRRPSATSMWSDDNVPTAHNTFGNPSYSGCDPRDLRHQSQLLNEVAFNYNGNRIAIVPQGVSHVPRASPRQAVSGPDNLDRHPGNQTGRRAGAEYATASWPWNNKADDYQIRDDISWTKGAHQFKMGGSWAHLQEGPGSVRSDPGSFTFNNNYTGVDFADFLLGYANRITSWRFRITATGTTFRGPRISRTTGAPPNGLL